MQTTGMWRVASTYWSWISLDGKGWVRAKRRAVRLVREACARGLCARRAQSLMIVILTSVLYMFARPNRSLGRLNHCRSSRLSNCRWASFRFRIQHRLWTGMNNTYVPVDSPDSELLVFCRILSCPFIDVRRNLNTLLQSNDDVAGSPKFSSVS